MSPSRSHSGPRSHGHADSHKESHTSSHKASHKPAHKPEHKPEHKPAHKPEVHDQSAVKPRVVGGTPGSGTGGDASAVVSSAGAAASATTFTALKLAEPLLEALTDEGYTTPTPIQAKAIPPILEGKDVLGCAQTGTGKTAAFALPVLDRLMRESVDTARRGPILPRALILSPTRELATQITDSFEAYGRHSGLSHTSIFGGVSQFHQVRALHRGVDILVATPGRLMDLMEQGYVNLTAIKILVLDEADRMLDMGFIQPIRHIAAKITKERQTLMFSATMPKEIMRLADSLLRNPVKVAVTPVASAAPLIEQKVYMVQKHSKPALLMHFLNQDLVERALVFTRTKRGAEKLMKGLRRLGVSADAIHGNKAQNARQRALESFRSGRSRVLVATDVAARGIDVDGVTHVFNYELPDDPESYVHRIGRTGRAGATGIAIAFCDSEERGQLRDIERLSGKKIPIVAELPELPVLKDMVQHTDDDDDDDRRPMNGHRGGSRGGLRGNSMRGRPSRDGARPGQGTGPNSAPPYGNSHAPRAPRAPYAGQSGGHAGGHSETRSTTEGHTPRVTLDQLKRERSEGHREVKPTHEGHRTGDKPHAAKPAGPHASKPHAPKDGYPKSDAKRPMRGARGWTKKR
jgi:ATP-dependent RNA helicase RhlE